MGELTFRRDILLDRLQRFSGTDLNKDLVTTAVNNWFQAFKRWESDDRFAKACEEGRMVIRQSVMEGMVPDSVVDGLGMRGISEPVTAGNTTYKDYRSNVGLSGIKDRMNPEKFKTVPVPHDTGTYKESRGKYYLGLHDLSASLFNPAKLTISEQCRWKDDGKERANKFSSWYLIFVPLAKEKDVAVLSLMSELAKSLKTGGKFAEMVAHVSKRMTRIKYAQETDMGAGFVSVGHKGEGADQLPKFRYGAGDVQSETVEGKTVTRPVQGIAAVRAKLAQDYSKLLRLQTEAKSGSNEVILRVRHHEGDRFPLITKWNSSVKGFKCKLGESGSRHIKNGVIPDDWKSVVED